MKQLARLALNGLVWMILLAIAWMVLFSVAAMIARHDWFPLLQYGFSLALFAAFIARTAEIRRLKKQIRELELALGL